MRFRLSTPLRLTFISGLVLTGAMLSVFNTLPQEAEERSLETRSSIESRPSSPSGLRFVSDRREPGSLPSFHSLGGLRARFSGEGVSLAGSGGSSEAVKLSIPGADLSRLEALRPLVGKVNVFQGRDPSKWVRDLMSYGAVTYREVFPGGDLTFRASGRQLQVELRVAPGESLDSLLLTFDNAHLSREDKRVTVDSGPNRWILSELTAFQYHSGAHRKVIVSHEVGEGGEVRLDFGGYSPYLSLMVSFQIAAVGSSRNAPQGTVDIPLWETTLGGVTSTLLGEWSVPQTAMWL